MKIIIVTGGSGGHIYPATTLAGALIDRGHEVKFIGTSYRMEKEVIPQMGYDFVGLKVTSTSGNIFNKIGSLITIFFNYFKCRKIVKGYDMAIGFGNYISIPVMLAAKHMGLKTVIHEQNSYVGRANRYLDEKVDLVIGCYPEDKKQFKNKNIKIIGNPQSDRAFKIEKDSSVIPSFGLDPSKKTIVIFMGSLGSSTVSNIVCDYLNKTDGSYQVIYATGNSDYDNVVSRVNKDYIKILKRIDAVKVMRNSDLVICRAGASSLSEIAALGITSILIPSPYVPNNHQFYNAKALTDHDAAIMIEEKDLNSDVLNNKVNELINNDSLREEISRNALKLANKNVLEDTIKELEKL